jgi:polar amino acid transport system substrate-binding protein
MASIMSSSFSRRQAIALGAGALSTLGLAACGGSNGSDSSNSSSSTKATGVKALTHTKGKLTVATGNPAYTPWVIDDKPQSGKGFEAALIYALAKEMGFSKSEVKWVRTTFDEAYAPGEHKWDLNIQQVSINSDRKKAVDFSPAYFRPTQAVVLQKSSKYASATKCSDLADANIGVMVGTTAYDYVKKIIKGGKDEGISIFDDNSAAAQAVTAGQADALVTDTPQAVYMVQSKQIKKGLVVGQIPGTEDPEGLGITLAKNSQLTKYVTKAMNALIKDGTVKKLQDKWLAEYTTDIPTLKK